MSKKSKQKAKKPTAEYKARTAAARSKMSSELNDIKLQQKNEEAEELELKKEQLTEQTIKAMIDKMDSDDIYKLFKEMLSNNSSNSYQPVIYETVEYSDSSYEEEMEEEKRAMEAARRREEYSRKRDQEWAEELERQRLEKEREWQRKQEVWRHHEEMRNRNTDLKSKTANCPYCSKKHTCRLWDCTKCGSFSG